MVQKIKYLSFIIASFFIVFQLMAQVAGKDSVIRVGIFQDQPKLYFDDEKKPAGIFVELIEEVAKNDHSNLNWIILVTAIVFLTGVTFAFLIFLINRKDRDLSQTNQFLNREEHKFRSYIENAPYGVFVANEKGQFTDVNPMSCSLTGYSKDELLTKKITNLIPDEAQGLALDHFNRVGKEGKAIKTVPYLTKAHFETLIEPLVTGKNNRIIFETQHFRKNGTAYDAEIHLQIIEYESEKQFLAVVIDITERKKTEQELRQLKDKLEHEIKEQTEELQNRVTELEQFREVTIERELRMEQLRREIEMLKKLNVEK